MNKKILFFILLTGVLVFPLVGQAIGDAPSSGITELDDILNNIEDVIQAIGVAMIVIGFVVAGIMYLISGGSTEKTGIAKKALIAALIGAVIVILAYSSNTLVKIIKAVLNVD